MSGIRLKQFEHDPCLGWVVKHHRVSLLFFCDIVVLNPIAKASPMAHNPAWLVNKHPKDLKAQIRELTQNGYTVTVQDKTSAQLVRKKQFSCLVATLGLLTFTIGFWLYLFYFLAQRDETIYLDLETQHPDPHWKEKAAKQRSTNMKLIAAGVGGVILLSAIVAALADVEEPTTTTQEAAIIDAPAILGMTIEEARAQLGTPEDGDLTEPNARQMELGTTTWNNSFTVSGYGILLDYDVKTREVTEFFIETNEDDLGDGGTGETRDWKPLLGIAGLTQSADSYTLIPVEALAHPGYYTGLRALDK
jgi:hypothetical protein